MTDLLNKLKINDSKIKEIEKDEKIALHNVTCNDKTWLEIREKEFATASGSRKDVVEDQIESLKKQIKRNEKEVNDSYGKKKVNVLKDSFESIVLFLEDNQKDVIAIISENESKLDELKKKIVNATNSNNFELAKDLSEEATIARNKITKNKETLDEIKALIDEVKDSIDKADGITYDGVRAIFEGYKSRAMEISILLNSENGKNPKLTNPTPTNPKPNGPTPSNDDKLKETLNKINDLLAKADKDLDEKALDEAVELIKTLPEGKDKEDLQAEAAEINEKINKAKNASAEIEIATKLVEKAERDKKYSSIDKAYSAVKKLPDSDKKNELLVRLNELVIFITEEFMDMVKKAEEKVENIGINSYDLISNEEVNKIKEIFNELYEKEIPKIGFKKSEYGKKVAYIILKYNMQEQNNYKNNLEVELDKKGKVKKPFNKWQIITELRPLLITGVSAKAFKNILAKNIKKLKKIEEKNDLSEREERKIEKLNNKIENCKHNIQLVDIINTPRLFVNKNKLAKLKPKLYKDGINGLDDKETKIYNKSVENISSKMAKKILKIIDKGEVVKDKLRVKTVISQALELLSICPEKVEIKNFFGKVVENYDKEEIIEKINHLLLDAHSEKSILPEEYQAYHDELWNIVLYHKEVDQYYEIPSVDYNDNGLKYHDELDDKTVEYYKTPISYTDENEEIKIIPYVKKSRK